MGELKIDNLRDNHYPSLSETLQTSVDRTHLESKTFNSKPSSAQEWKLHRVSGISKSQTL